MATSVTLPALGESVTEGTVTRWLKQPGDQVAVDEPLLEVSTDKVDTEIPSPVAGTLLEIKADEDETIEVGAELCTIGDEGESGGSSDESGGERADVDPDAGAESGASTGSDSTDERRRGPQDRDGDRPAGRADRLGPERAGDRTGLGRHQAGGRGLAGRHVRRRLRHVGDAARAG